MSRWTEPGGCLRPFPLMPVPAMVTLAHYVQRATRIGEWGAGGSTLWMATLNPGATIHSVEDDTHWLHAVASALAGMQAGGLRCAATALHHAPAETPADVAGYAASLKPWAPYDLLLIDGAHESRVTCAHYARFCCPAGIVWLDNAGAYPEALTVLADHGFRCLVRGDEGHGGWWAGTRAP